MSAAPAVAGIRSDRSLGVARYVAGLADAMEQEGIDYRPASAPLPDRYSHFHLANSSRSFLANGLVARGPLVVTVHDVLPRTRALMPLYRTVAYPALARAAAVIVHSNFSATLLQRLSVRHRRLEVILHPARPHVLSRSAARRALAWEDGAPLFVLPGVAKRAKLVREVLTAAAPLIERKRLRLALVGPMHARVARAARAAGALVMVAPDDRRYGEAIVAADVILVLRTRSVGETNGPLLDALGAGRAILATATGSIPEVAAAAAHYCLPTVAGIRAGLEALCDVDERADRAAAAMSRAAALSPTRAAAAHAEVFDDVFCA